MVLTIVRRPQEFAFQRASINVQLHRLRQIALGHGGDRARNFRGGPQQIVHQRIDRNFHLAPRAVRLVKAHALARWPSLPTTCPTRFSSCAICWFAVTMSLNVSAIFPASPVQFPGRRTEKSPSRIVWRLARIMLRSADAASALGEPRPLLFALGAGSGIAIAVVLFGSVRFMLFSAVQGRLAPRPSWAAALPADISI